MIYNNIFNMSVEPTNKDYVYDMEGEYNQASLPNTEELMDEVIKILTVITQPKYKELRVLDNKRFVSELEQLFPDFSFRYFALFMQVISGEDITPLIEMLLQIDRLKRGEVSIEDAEKCVGEALANRYIYPNVKKQ